VNGDAPWETQGSSRRATVSGKHGSLGIVAIRMGGERHLSYIWNNSRSKGYGKIRGCYIQYHFFHFSMR
jgi:hypothetical protein